MKKIFGEILFLLIAGIFGFLIFRGITTDSTQQQLQLKSTLTGKVSKSSLMISSPIYGELTSLPIYEGEFVKKGQIISTVKVISHPQDTTLLNTDVFSYKDDELTLYSPVDGIVATILTAEKSTVTPQTTFITIYPVSKVTVSIYLPMTDAIQNYKNFSTSVKKDAKKYPIVIKKSYPVKADQNNQVYFATFKNIEDSKAFYADQSVSIYADKIESKKQSAVQKMYNQTMSFIQSQINRFIKK